MIRILFLSIASLLFLLLQQVSAGSIEYWDTQRKGANFFNNTPQEKRFEDAKNAGIEVARIACSKWLNGRPDTELGDFLIGPKDQYNGLIQSDLDYLITVLDKADRAGLKVVLTLLSLPGSRWSQHNIINGKRVQQFDLWKDYKFQQQSADLWRDLANALKDHPAIVGYNILNEPCPERADWPKLRDWYTGDYPQWYQKIKGTPRDLNVFYKTVVTAIRSVDPNTPIVLDSGFYANPYAFQILDPAFLQDDNLIFAIHDYLPGRFTFGTPSDYTYPGTIPTGELDEKNAIGAEPPFAPDTNWNQQTIETIFKTFNEWAKVHKIPSNRIYISEFGVNRHMQGAANFLSNKIDYYNQQQWHWSFYSYREDDGYQVMDYELGTGPIPKGYWTYMDNYSKLTPKIYSTANPLWKIIESDLNLKSSNKDCH